MHTRSVEEAILVQDGTVEVAWRNYAEEQSVTIGAGDTLLLPSGVQHSYRNTSSAPAVLFVARGVALPQHPVFGVSTTV